VGSSHRIQSVLSLADDVDEDAGWSLDTFLVERSDEGQIFRIRRKRDGTVVLLQTQFDVTLRTGITPYSEDPYGVADRQVLAHEEMRRSGSVFQEASRVSSHWKSRAIITTRNATVR